MGEIDAGWSFCQRVEKTQNRDPSKIMKGRPHALRLQAWLLSMIKCEEDFHRRSERLAHVASNCSGIRPQRKD